MVIIVTHIHQVRIENVDKSNNLREMCYKNTNFQLNNTEKTEN